MTQTLLSVDLDWLNKSSDPAVKLGKLLKYIPPGIPVTFTVEHHQFLTWLRRLVRSGQISTPFDLINVDAHHDFYGWVIPERDHTMNCGNWGYRIPTKWLSSYTWIHNVGASVDGWTEATRYFRKRNIKFSKRSHLLFSRSKPNIAAAVFCVSPDYCSNFVRDKLPELVEMVNRHFDLQRAPYYDIKDDGFDCDMIADPACWEVRPRPEGVRKYAIIQ